ncbi:MAG: GAF domain-containing sensor histidine kinase [Candidatus Omnitrophica bacterium]|nr:GAF domain-containing sensor histidine kinase [Candidatus Omnitrophota bacterium]
MKKPQPDLLFLQQRLATLQRVSSFVLYIPNLHHLLELIMEESKDILNAEASSLLLYDPKKKALFFEVARGAKGDKVKRLRLKLGQGIAGLCAQERRVVNVPDVRKNSHFYALADRKSHFQTKSILAVPLLWKRKLLGVLEVLNKRGEKAFDSSDEELMEIIASQAALAIENAYLYRENLRKAHFSGVGQTMLSLSHDIKNILNGLMGGMSLVDEGMKRGEKENLEVGWNMVKRNVERISDLILDMLNFTTRKKPLYQKVNLPDFLESVAKIYQERVKEKNGSLLVEADTSLTDVYFDYQGMERVLVNLLSNAWEAIPASGGKIILSSRRAGENGWFEILVTDNGCGIPRDKINKVFEVFYTTKGHKGTGLGLPVAKKIVGEHRGKIKVESTVGQGTTFVITLPTRPPDETPDN